MAPKPASNLRACQALACPKSALKSPVSWFTTSESARSRTDDRRIGAWWDQCDGIPVDADDPGRPEIRLAQKIRDEGYDLYVVLDATIGLNKQDDDESVTASITAAPAEAPQTAVVKSDKSVQFRINVNDLALLRQLGIDPTRRVRTARRIEPLGTPSESE